VAWWAVLSQLSLSLVYPSLAIGYALTALLAWLVLGEQVSPVRWLGIVTICLGVFLLSRS
jgi:multidrug transporter EmrE-like cation transporter